jgi:hypothetical protein
LLGLLLVADLGRANQPWVNYWNYKAQYASDPILDRLREKPYEQRVTMLPFHVPTGVSLLGQFYHGQWMKYQFQYYNIQSLDTVQLPRMPEDVAAFTKALSPQGAPDFLRIIMRA